MPKEEELRASRPAARNAAARAPGLWQAAIVAALTALACGYWASRGVSATDASAAPASRIAEAGLEDITAALGTVDWSPAQLAQFRERDSCARRLAVVTVVRSPGQPPGRIRLQSGAYVSPAFDLSDAPVRVALPFPAPYGTGHGAISVLGTTAGAVVALTPPWPVAAEAGVHARQVTWTPAGDCPGGGG